MHTVVRSARGQLCVGAAAVRCLPGPVALCVQWRRTRLGYIREGGNGGRGHTQPGRPSPSIPEAGSSIAAPFGARALATGAWFWAPRRSVLATPIARAAPVTKSALSGAHSAQNAPVSQWRLRPIERPWRRARLRARSGLPGAARRAPPPTTLTLRQSVVWKKESSNFNLVWRV